MRLPVFVLLMTMQFRKFSNFIDYIKNTRDSIFGQNYKYVLVLSRVTQKVEMHCTIKSFITSYVDRVLPLYDAYARIMLARTLARSFGLERKWNSAGRLYPLLEWRSKIFYTSTDVIFNYSPG